MAAFYQYFTCKELIVNSKPIDVSIKIVEVFAAVD